MTKFLIAFAISFSAQLPVYAMSAEIAQRANMNEAKKSHQEQRELIDEHNKTGATLSRILNTYYTKSRQISSEEQLVKKLLEKKEPLIISSEVQDARARLEAAAENYDATLKNAKENLGKVYLLPLEWEALRNKLNFGHPREIVVDMGEMRKISQRMKEIEAMHEKSTQS